MKKKLQAFLSSGVAKKAFLALALCILLFFVCNDLLMPWYVNSRGEVPVPEVIGLKAEEAFKVLDSVGLEPRIGDTLSDRRYKIGSVINQHPVAGRIVNRERRIYLTISGGEQLVTVPNLKGRTFRDAKFQLERAGLKLGGTEYQPSETFPENTIMGQEVAAGYKVKRDVYVSVVVSMGKTSEKVTVPDVKGKSLKEAELILKNAGVVTGNISFQPMPDLLPNTVVDQFPRAGELVPRGQAIDLFVVQGAENSEGY
jgi:eukaryotic-like serine/threonine-protein kinase